MFWPIQDQLPYSILGLAEEAGVNGQKAIREDLHLSLEVSDADPLGYRNIRGEHCRL